MATITRPRVLVGIHYPRRFRIIVWHGERYGIRDPSEVIAVAAVLEVTPPPRRVSFGQYALQSTPAHRTHVRSPLLLGRRFTDTTATPLTGRDRNVKNGARECCWDYGVSRKYPWPRARPYTPIDSKPFQRSCTSADYRIINYMPVG